jgi:hypothetical protein
MKISLQNKSELHISNLHQAFSYLIGQDEKVNIVAQTGIVGSISCNLLRFFSPFVNDLLNDIPCCTKPMIIMPVVVTLLFIMSSTSLVVALPTTSLCLASRSRR